MIIHSNKNFSKKFTFLLFLTLFSSFFPIFSMETGKNSEDNSKKLEKAFLASAFKGLSKDKISENIELLLKVKDILEKDKNKSDEEKFFKLKDPEKEYQKKLLKLSDAEQKSFSKAENKKKFIAKVIKHNEDLENLGEHINDALQQSVTKIAKESSPLKEKDVIIRGFLGNNWKVLADLNPDSYIDALKYLAIFKTSEVVGTNLDNAIKETLGKGLENIFGGMLGGFGKATTYIYRSIRNFIKDRSGDPFSATELNLLRDSVKQTFQELDRVLSKSSIMDARSRDKIYRGDETETEAIDPLWLGQKIGLERQLNFWVNTLKKRCEYYDPVSDEAIIFYSSQIKDALEDIKENFVLPSKSQKEFGSSANQQALQIRRSIIDINFGNLIKYVSPKSSDDKGLSKDSSSSLMRSTRRDNDLL